MARYKWPFTLLVVPFLAGSCSNDTYESGDGDYSYLRADFVEAHTKAPNEIDYAVTDNRDSLALSPRYRVSWASQADTNYRGLLYYSKVDHHTAIASRFFQVPVVAWQSKSKVKAVRTDPVVFESAWISRNRRYLNIGFSVKTARQNDGKKGQTIAVVATDSMELGGHIRQLWLTLYHDQGGIPEYYSSKGYISVPLQRLPKGCHIRLTVRDYRLIVKKDFVK